jgi:pantoate--beta-alanine ligase
MSSRNIHLMPTDRKNALVLNKALEFVRDNFDILSLDELLREAKRMINETPGVVLEYFTIANGEDLMPIKDKTAKYPIVLVAAKVGQTRLIDNMLLNSH